jgi:putative component of membrane protein insertase Oxa1/YidC/SpoIIIJ protein YidD
MKIRRVDCELIQTSQYSLIMFITWASSVQPSASTFYTTCVTYTANSLRLTSQFFGLHTLNTTRYARREYPTETQC